MKKKTTKIVTGAVALATAALLGYELWSLSNTDSEDTLSENYWKIGGRNTALPFAMGFLMGHLNWQSERVLDYFREDKKK